MILKSSTVPDQSVLSRKEHYDFIDSYSATFVTDKVISSDDLARSFFSSDSKWITYLFVLRNKIVSLFGLKTGENNQQQVLLNSYVVGESIGLFKIIQKTEKEIIFGENDKHLDFKVSLLIDQSKISNSVITISTVVIFNNFFGRFYFFFIKSFHKLIVPNMLKKMVRTYS